MRQTCCRAATVRNNRATHGTGYAAAGLLSAEWIGRHIVFAPVSARER
jgi:hypothetical protein